MILWKAKLFWFLKNWNVFQKKMFHCKVILLPILIMLLLIHLLMIRIVFAPHLLLLKMIYVCWRRVLIVWAPLWANVPWITRDWNPCITRNVLHICMHTLHGIHMLLMFTHMTPCILMCTLVHIVDVRATLQFFL